MRFLALFAFSLVIVVPAVAQRPRTDSDPRIEVVSVKPAVIPPDALAQIASVAGGCPLSGIERSTGRVAVPVGNLCGLIRAAFDVADYQVFDIPKSLSGVQASTVFEIEARIDGGAEPSPQQARQMLQSMLADRFKLRVRREPREMPVYALIATDGGPKPGKCANPEAASGYTPGRLVSCTPPIPMPRVAQMLTRAAGRPVIDRVGTGPFMFELHWLPDGAPMLADSPPSLFTALQEQVGLRLQPTRAEIESIVVEYADQPTPN
jgi:uncharacterized protein (TIGR03435 family)